MGNYDKFTKTFYKLDKFDSVQLLEKPKIIKQELVIGYDGNFPFVLKKVK